MNKAFEKILERLECEIKYYSAICKNNYFKGKFNAFVKAKQIVQEVAEEYNDGWIPCSERLPEDKGKYLVCDDKK